MASQVFVHGLARNPTYSTESILVQRVRHSVQILNERSRALVGPQMWVSFHHSSIAVISAMLAADDIRGPPTKPNLPCPRTKNNSVKYFGSFIPSGFHDLTLSNMKSHIAYSRSQRIEHVHTGKKYLAHLGMADDLPGLVWFLQLLYLLWRQFYVDSACFYVITDSQGSD